MGSHTGATAYYRTTDPMKHIKIKVRIDRVTPSSAIFANEIAAVPTDPNRPSSDTAENMAGTETDLQRKRDSRTFFWQERIYSRAELELYKDLRNCDTVRKKDIHGDIESMSASQRQMHGGRLFTYVDMDINWGRHKPTPLTDDDNLTESYLSNNTAPYRPRRPRIEDVNQQSDRKEVFRLMSPRHDVAPATTAMYIVADLSEPDMPRSDNENSNHVLCKIVVNAEGGMAVQPDFNAFREPYLIVINCPSGGTEKYAYHLEHLSEDINRMDSERENQLFRALYQRYYNHQAALMGSTFDRLSDGFTRLFYSGEIISADGFEHESIFVHFLLETPPGWSSIWDSLDNKEPTHLSSQISQRDKDGKHFFGCPFAWNMEYSAENQADSVSNYKRTWPRLLFEVVSLDSWNRYSVEGYGFLDILSNAGSTTEILHTWRPTGGNAESQLRRYFIGGGLELEDLSYASIPQDFKGKEFSRYGFHTTPSGRLAVRHNLVLQHRATESVQEKQTFEPYRSRLRVKGDAENASFVAFDPAVEGVLEAFKRARRRLLEARGILNVD